MSGQFEIGLEHADARLAATRAFADAAVAPSRIRLYSTPAPHNPAEEPMAEIILARPCGSVVDHALVLQAANPAGTMLLANGVPIRGRWVDGNGLLVAQGSVTDDLHTGLFRIQGGATAPGAESPMLYAGGMVLLGETVLT